jgi:MarR family transcriptional regulator, organic hydroperoxide resistance regulator
MTKRAPRNTGVAALSSCNPESESFRIAAYPFYRIARVAGLYTDCLNRELKPRGMDQPHWRVLMLLSEHNPASMGLLAEHAVMKLPTLLKVIRRMSDEGLVRHRPRPTDQRVVEITITPQGRRALAVVRRVAAQVYTQVTSSLSERDIAALNEILQRLEGDLLKMRGGK